ncbi:MAG: endonuclease/exonuclease/phosphatase family protein [Clostridia bacterium]|nr:endonuclease/exonuclease/phosphatase family protein [Clostridia bacterium]
MFWNNRKGAGLIKTILKIILVLVLVVVIAAIGYLAYIMLDYSRIEDDLALDPHGTSTNGAVTVGTKYTVVTQNLGFGAYTPEFTFFMDGGTQSWAESKESVISCIDQGANNVKGFLPDFVFFQEVDTDSTRSYHVDQSKQLAGKFDGFMYTEAVNYHSSFLMYPITQPHGFANSELMTFSKYEVASAIRRSFPISEGFSKFLDLDRCFSKSYVKVAGGDNYLVLYNVHSSAYGGSDEIRTAQMTKLFEDMQAEYEKGNYCVCGGDFNHDFTGDSKKKLNPDMDIRDDYGWAQAFPAELLSKYDITQCIEYSDSELKATCRDCDIPYKEGNFTVIVDGFLISKNVECVDVWNRYNGFTYSDHAPVQLDFRLKAA